MREIKFKVFDKRKNKIYKVIKLSESFDGDCEEAHCYYLNDDENLEWLPLSEGNLMQFTGIVDVNGKEIFEGDKVRCYGGEFCQGYWEHDITFIVNDITNHYIMIDLNNSDYVEIIGNIYEV